MSNLYIEVGGRVRDQASALQSVFGVDTDVRAVRACVRFCFELHERNMLVDTIDLIEIEDMREVDHETARAGGVVVWADEPAPVEGVSGHRNADQHPIVFRQGVNDRQAFRHGKAKLTKEKVSEIRKTYAEGGVTLRALAQEYGVTTPTISQIVNRKTWTDVE